MYRLLTDTEVEHRVIALVNQARERYSIAIGVDGRIACRKAGLKVVFEPLPLNRDGMLTPDGVVVVNSLIGNAARVEFTLFHELTHHLLDNDGDVIEHYTAMLANDEKAYDAAVERCCNAGAAEFLMPRHLVKELIALSGFSADIVPAMVKIFGVSLPAAAIQLAKCAPVPCYVVLCSERASAQGGVAQLVVEQAADAIDRHYPIARGTVIPDDHLFHQVWRSGSAAQGAAVVPFRSGRTFPCQHAEAIRHGTRVIGILYMAHPPRPGQLSLGLA